MNTRLMSILLCGAGLLTMNVGPALADAHESDAPDIVPIELYACKYNDGQSEGDLNRVIARWNTWMDETEAAPYSAWTLTPFYFSAEQDFDFLWMGAAPDGETLGRGHDQWIADGGRLAGEFDRVSPCDVHLNFATMNIKEPPKREDPSRFVLTFADCTIADGRPFDEAISALQAWSTYRGEHGSQAGMWILFPAFGGGDAEFDFKVVTSHANHTSLGVDYDQYGKGGYAKAGELFDDLLECDDARVYNGKLHRDGMSSDE